MVPGSDTAREGTTKHRVCASVRSGEGNADRSALDDIQASIDELKFYQKNIFIPIESESTPSIRDDKLKTAI